ncbi:dienelactone hydrolase family protein [Sabulicella rubraurantiaca]|uniref:dienelactone hydrolase family protein n=1 Tax=Sabulicella rubraurantiaca TaxID=2811429 RepID=UPI001A964C09|nr:dienelactone hydrolase family protein [Sabulicella rubraurantiaca]
MIRALPLLFLLLLGCATPDEAAPPLPASAREVTLPGPGGVALRALVLTPETPRGPAVVALHGCSGIGGGGSPIRLGARERDWTARLVAAGHPVIFPDSFGSRGLGEACGQRPFPAGPFSVRRDDALAVAAWATAQGWGRPVLLGWSHGGSTTLAAWAAAPPGALSGAVALYPGCLGAPAPSGAVPMLLLLGGSDDWTPAAPCEGWAARAPGRVVAATFSGAHHGFDGLSGGLRRRSLPDGRTVSLGPDGAARGEARRRVMEFLAALP